MRSIGLNALELAVRGRRGFIPGVDFFGIRLDPELSSLSEHGQRRTASKTPDRIKRDISSRKSTIKAPEKPEDLPEKSLDLVISHPFPEPPLGRIKKTVVEELMDPKPEVTRPRPPDKIPVLVELDRPG
jgi:hypothetical protein